MEPIYHLVLPSLWFSEMERDYVVASLPTEGFIHCSFVHQVTDSANKHYALAEELLVLEIDPERLRSPLKMETSRGGAIFPHVYGPINRDAVRQVIALVRSAGRWMFPARA